MVTVSLHDAAGTVKSVSKVEPQQLDQLLMTLPSFVEIAQPGEYFSHRACQHDGRPDPAASDRVAARLSELKAPGKPSGKPAKAIAE